MADGPNLVAIKVEYVIGSQEKPTKAREGKKAYADAVRKSAAKAPAHACVSGWHDTKLLLQALAKGQYADNKAIIRRAYNAYGGGVVVA